MFGVTRIKEEEENIAYGRPKYSALPLITRRYLNFVASVEFGRQRGPNSGKNANISYSEKKHCNRESPGYSGYALDVRKD
jgi:hypothetical protein